METYTLTDDKPTHWDRQGRRQIPQRTRHKVTKEGMLLIYEAYCKMYGACQSLEQLERRGGMFTSEVRHFIESGVLPKRFNWTQYVVPSATC